MPVDPTMVRELVAAFPAGYLSAPGTTTVGGVQVLRGKDGQCLWYWPQEAKFGRPGLEIFDTERPKMSLLPDLEDEATWGAVLRLMARRVGIDGPHMTPSWVPKSKEVVDRKRGSVGKAIAGWTLRSLTRQALFLLPDVKSEEVALLRAVAMTNCACGRGLKRDCPMHGEIRARPWR